MTQTLKTIARLGCVTLAALTLQSTTYGGFEQTKEMADQTRWVMNTINARHYLHGKMEKLNGTEIVEAFTESFDYGRMYFQRSEVDDFVFRFGDAMEDFLQKGNLYAAFEIYAAYQANVQARTDWAYQRLSQDFDFSLDEKFFPDRRKAKWPATAAESNDLWERRLKYELLNELLSLASEEQEEALEYGETSNPDNVSDQENGSFDSAKIKRLVEDSEFMVETLDAAREKIRRRYERNLTYIIDREAAEVQESFINAMTQLFDPHSSFLSADTLESFNSAVQNSFVGIGALLEDDDGICTIKQILPGGPAEESGLLHDEDKIIAVAQGKDGEFEDVVDMQLRYVVRKIKGEKGSIVRLLIRPGSAGDPSARKDISITRGDVKLTANLASAKLIDIPNADGGLIPVGVIQLPSFYGNIGAGNTLTTTAGDVTELLKKLSAAGAQGIILDLRMNGGGLLSEAVRVAGLFIPIGPVVQVRNPDGRTDVLSDRDLNLEWKGPLIVLTSRFSASASEIVAGALQDHGRALVVGNTSTHGKGTVQEVYHMNRRPAFSWFQNNAAPQARPVASKITIKQFYLPGGSSTQLKGVPSDIALPSVNEFLPIGESDLPHALAWDEIPEVDWFNDWKKLNISSPEEPKLKTALAQNSTSRQSSLAEFAFLQEQIEWRKGRYDEKDISLDLEQRIARKIEDQMVINRMDDAYEALSKTNYAEQDFILEIAQEQDALSKQNLLEKGAVEVALDAAETTNDLGASVTAIEPDSDETIEEEEEDKPDFDIYLRESARIMADWIELEATDKAAISATKIAVTTGAL
ncbi:MAG: carboxy terminal-processing peptidase [Opitutae bacterium]|nr:carboxy terminal-processing peptidase [Opitutae bacterium]